MKRRYAQLYVLLTNFNDNLNNTHTIIVEILLFTVLYRATLIK